MASIINVSEKYFKVKSFGRKCQHSPQFLFSFFHGLLNNYRFQKIEFQPIMVLQSMLQKNILRSKVLEANANIPVIKKIELSNIK
jgi:hypothetical protein